MSNTSTEQQALERIALSSRYLEAPNAATTLYSCRVFLRYLRGSTVLELGPAEGLMTEQLVANGYKVTAVEGSHHFCTLIRSRIKNVNVVHSMFEQYETDKKYDNIILGHVLEHVEDPVSILRKARTWLKTEGRLLAAVPNARSLHRQAAVIMGLLPAEDALNDTDRHHGHRRVFNPESFRQLFIQSDFTIDLFGGYWLKPVSNAQIEAQWDSKMIDAFMRLGERYPDIAAEIL